MRAVLTSSLILAALVPLLGHAALADGNRRAAGPKPARYGETAPKDCTRYNGRHGFYANAWCSPAEQQAWDLWDASRHAARAGK